MNHEEGGIVQYEGRPVQVSSDGGKIKENHMRSNHRLKLTGSRGGNPECPRLSLIVMRTVVYSKNIGPFPVVN